MNLIDDWDVADATYHTNARLVALERILTDPVNEDVLLWRANSEVVKGLKMDSYILRSYAAHLQMETM